MTQPIYNLHNHTPFSDGAYDADEICAAHVAYKDLKIEGVGISDHLFCTPSSQPVGSPREFERLFAAETRNYVTHVYGVRQRWAGKLRIFCGCEINWTLNKPHLDLIRQHLDGIDYVLFECVDWAGLTQLANQARRWPCPIGLAHTDVSRQFPNTSMDQVVRTIANARIFYEINTKLEPLSDHERWFNILPNHRVLISYGTDTHDDLECIPDMKSLVEYAREHGLGEKCFLPRIRAEESVVA